MRVCKETINDPDANDLYHRAGFIAAEVHELMKNTAPLKAVSLSDPYKLLADFNGYVLGGMEPGRGVQFVTWEWTYDMNGLTLGHYCDNDYALPRVLVLFKQKGSSRRSSSNMYLVKKDPS